MLKDKIGTNGMAIQGYESKPSPAVPPIKKAKDNCAPCVTNWGKSTSGTDSRPLRAGNSDPYDKQK
jgi:hypothetical protein